MACSDLWAIHQRKFSSRFASDEITTHGYRVLTFVKCTTIMIVELAVRSGVEWLEGFWCSLRGIV
jgi:hypothetical protein